MDQSAIASLAFAPPAMLPLAVDFLGGRLTSDGGWTWIAEADAALGLTAALAAVLPDPRRRRGRHSRLEAPRQRIYQIAAGYEDQDDAYTLRREPPLKLVCGRLPESDPTWPASRRSPGSRTPAQRGIVTVWPRCWGKSICVSGVRGADPHRARSG